MEPLHIAIAIAVVIAVGLLIVFGKGGSPADAPPTDATDEDILAFARQGQKIQAVKWYRALHGVGLKEAKDAVEAMMRNE